MRRLRDSLYVRGVARGSVVLLVPLLLIAVLGNVLADPSSLRVVINFFITLIIVLGLQMFTGNSGVVSYGHVAFVAVGAYVTGWLTVPVVIKQDIFKGLPDWLLHAQWGFVPTVLVAAAAAVAAAVIVGFAIMRMKETAMAMATLGLLVIANGVFTNLVGWTAGPLGVYGLPERTNLWIAMAASMLIVVAALLFKNSRLGLRLRASREDSLAAEATGVSVVRVRFVAWALSAAVCGAAGSIWAQYNLAFGPNQFFFTMIFGVLAILVIGGTSTVSGAVVATALVTVATEALRRLELSIQVGGLEQMILALATLLILIYRPNGIMGWTELDAVVFDRSRRARSDPSPVEAGGKGQTPGQS
jgi:branched-chain amino acid transport system permease protein